MGRFTNAYGPAVDDPECPVSLVIGKSMTTLHQDLAT